MVKKGSDPFFTIKIRYFLLFCLVCMLKVIVLSLLFLLVFPFLCLCLLLFFFLFLFHLPLYHILYLALLLLLTLSNQMVHLLQVLTHKNYMLMCILLFLFAPYSFLQILRSITKSFPFAFIGLSPSFSFTGTWPFIMCEFFVYNPNSFKILSHMSSFSINIKYGFFSSL